VKLPTFDYHRPRTIDEALETLAKYGDEAAVLAGGQSLVPALALRLSAPAVLVDLNGIDGLADLEPGEKALRLGPMVRHRALETAQAIRETLPLIAMAMPHIAHPAIRNRGTIGGSVAQADPAAELPAVLVAHDATIVLRSTDGERRVPARGFFRGLYETARQPAEMITGIEIPNPPADERVAFGEIARRHGDYALAGVLLRARIVDRRIAAAELVLFGACDRPIRIHGADSLLAERRLDDPPPDDLDAVLTEGWEPLTDGETDAKTRHHLCRVLTCRALAALARGDGDANRPAGPAHGAPS
jgi:carbon-monoxide dehydrogenase medium subunit